MNTQMSLFELMTAPVSPAKAYHNTVGLSGDSLLKHQTKAKGLATAILDFFERHPGEMFTAETTHASLHLPAVPLWSVRARISDLTKAGKLQRMKQEKTLGSYGHPISYYSLRQ